MGTGKGKTDYLLSLIREGKQMTLGQQLSLTAGVAAEPARHFNTDYHHRHAVYRRLDDRQPRCECRCLYRAGLDHDMAVLGAVYSRRNGLLRSSSA